jgi:hypothetical protein
VERTPPIADLRRELEHRILARTGRRVRRLTVELQPERGIRRGRAASYYVQQLAQHGVRAVLPEVPVEKAIAVESAA